MTSNVILGKDGKLKKVPRDAAMKQRWKAGGSKKVRVVKSKGAA
jgi:hypothetical protein